MSSKSKDPATKVGAIVVGPDNEIRLTGFNGIPQGVEDRPERYTRELVGDSAIGEKYLWCSHAEENTVSFAAREGIRLKGTTIVVTHMPCARCARMLVNAGVSEVVVANGTTSMPKREFDVATRMFREAGVVVSSYKD